MTNMSRPFLGSRAVSDIVPLSSPAPDASKGELGRGTQAYSGGARVVQGRSMALGGTAPFSPFLPLPPAPTTEELKRRYDHHGNSNETDMSQDEAHSRLLGVTEHHQRRASSNDIAEDKAQNNSTNAVHDRRKRMAKPAPFMIRSYSMPVATQNDFEAQQRAARLRRQEQQQQRSHLAWSMSRSNSNATDQIDPLSPPRSPLRTLMTTEMNATALARSLSKVSAAEFEDSQDTGRSTSLKWEAQSIAGDSVSTSSGSDDTDVYTPRAASPIVTEDGSGKDYDPVEAIADVLIHPGHLQPPPSWPTA